MYGPGSMEPDTVVFGNGEQERIQLATLSVADAERAHAQDDIEHAFRFASDAENELRGVTISKGDLPERVAFLMQLLPENNSQV